MRSRAGHAQTGNRTSARAAGGFCRRLAADTTASPCYPALAAERAAPSSAAAADPHRYVGRFQRPVHVVGLEDVWIGRMNEALHLEEDR